MDQRHTFVFKATSEDLEGKKRILKKHLGSGYSECWVCFKTIVIFICVLKCIVYVSELTDAIRKMRFDILWANE